MSQQLSQSDESPELKDFGFLAFAIERFFRGLQFVTPSVIVGSRADFQKNLEKAGAGGRRELARKRSMKIDRYVVAWLVIELIAVVLFAWRQADVPSLAILLVRIIATLRIVDIAQVSANTVVFDHLRLKRYGHDMASYVRTLVIMVLNYGELLICFGLIYVTMLGNLDQANDWTDAYYFSVISQLTIGYGDIAPLGIAKIVAITQGVVGYFFALLILARFVTILPLPRSVLGDDT